MSDLVKLLNVRTSSVGIRRNDVMKLPISSSSDEKLDKLLNYANFFKQWRESKRAGLNTETSIAIENLCRNMRSLIVHLIDDLDFRFVLTGQITSDSLVSIRSLQTNVRCQLLHIGETNHRKRKKYKTSLSSEAFEDCDRFSHSWRSYWRRTHELIWCGAVWQRFRSSYDIRRPTPSNLLRQWLLWTSCEKDSCLLRLCLCVCFG